MSNGTGRTVGVDLGTTNSCVAFMRDDGQIEVIPSREGGRTTPSVFAVDETGTVLVGKPAVDQEAVNPDNTVRSIKRKMGTADRVQVAGKAYSPEEISAEILKKLKEDAEAYMGEPVSGAVITVPAYFNNDQRMSTKTAGELAGLKVLQIINEPTAASLAYGLDKSVDQTVLVYDLGGGTFDVTILKIADGMDFLVQSTDGDTMLGGDDFDSALIALILGDNQVDNSEQYARVREAAEQAKKELSSARIAHINIPYFTFAEGKPVHIRTSITREQFEAAIEPYIERTKKCVASAAREAKVTFKDIDEVVFVGGSTRIPRIGNAVEDWTGRKPNRSINPDEAVAIGAAIQASVLGGETDKMVFLVDVTPLSLGVETQGGVMDVLIRRNTHVPAEASQSYTTAYDNQTSVEVQVFQGERPQTKDNKKLGDFKLDIAPAPARVPMIEVLFSIDENGILAVRATDKATGVEKEVTLTGTSSLTSDEIRQMLEDAEKNKAGDAMFIAVSNLQAAIKDQIIQIEELLRTSILEEGVVEDLCDLKTSLLEAQDSTNLELMNGLVESTKETLDDVSKIVYERAKQHVDS